MESNKDGCLLEGFDTLSSNAQVGFDVGVVSKGLELNNEFCIEACEEDFPPSELMLLNQLSLVADRVLAGLSSKGLEVNKDGWLK